MINPRRVQTANKMYTCAVKSKCVFKLQLTFCEGTHYVTHDYQIMVLEAHKTTFFKFYDFLSNTCFIYCKYVTTQKPKRIIYLISLYALLLISASYIKFCSQLVLLDKIYNVIVKCCYANRKLSCIF